MRIYARRKGHLAACNKNAIKQILVSDFFGFGCIGRLFGSAHVDSWRIFASAQNSKYTLFVNDSSLSKYPKQKQSTPLEIFKRSLKV